MEKFKGLCCDHSYMLENYSVSHAYRKKLCYTSLSCVFPPKEMDSTSYSMSAFHSSCGMKKPFLCPGTGFQGDSLGSDCIFIRSCLAKKIIL